MPTRIVLREPPPAAGDPLRASSSSSSVNRRRRRGIEELDLNAAREGADRDHESGENGLGGGGGGGGVDGKDKKVVRRWRRALDPTHRRHTPRKPRTPQLSEGGGTGRSRHQLSHTDISASPRLVGYMYMMVSGLVCALSAMRFHQEDVPGFFVKPHGTGRRRLLAYDFGAWGGDGAAVSAEAAWGDDSSSKEANDGATVPSEDWSGRSLQESVIDSSSNATNDTLMPSRILSSSPSNSLMPSSDPSLMPSGSPSSGPSLSLMPSGSPSSDPSLMSSGSPSSDPSLMPSGSPSSDPSLMPSGSPSSDPSLSLMPSGLPSELPSLNPSSVPSTGPSVSAMPSVSFSPSAMPSVSFSPSAMPSINNDSLAPSSWPSLLMSSEPSSLPSVSSMPSSVPSIPPSSRPSTEAEKILSSVAQWKLLCAIIVPAVASGICLLVIAVHFDKSCFPKTWQSIFRDGSKGERNLLVFLFLLWGGILYICTSANSLGYIQANVFFSSWIGFFSVLLTYGLWRSGAGQTSIISRIRKHPRQTTYNWVCLLVISFILMIVVFDLRYASNSSNTLIGIKQNEIPLWEWRAIMITPAATVVVSALAPFLSHWTLRPGTRKWIKVTWNIVEGLLLLGIVGVWSYSLLNFTGVNGIVNGVNNAYVAVWGTFLCAVFAMGTWFREGSGLLD